MPANCSIWCRLRLILTVGGCPLSLFAELKRRNVFRVVLAYLVVAWLLLQIGDTLAPALRLPEWVTSLLAFFLILGFPLAVFFAWAYEMTPKGLRLEKEIQRDQSIAANTGRKLDFVIIALLAVAVAYFAFDKYASNGTQPTEEIFAAADATPARRSIAVLPFVNMSSDLEQGYFSDGLSEELLNLLSKIPQLRVTSRSSAFSFRDKDFTIAEVGRQLGVSHVLEGSVRKSGNQIRITAQLIDVKSDAHLWSETWDRDLNNIFEIQDEISGSVVNALKIQLVDELPHAYVTDAESYALYLRASELMADYSESSLEQADSLLQRVIDVDPNYGPAFIKLSQVSSIRGSWGYRPRDEAAEMARDYAQRAITSNPDLAEGYLALADAEASEKHDWESEKLYIQKALAVDPNNLEAKRYAAASLLRKGETKPNLDAARELLEVDPLSALTYRRLGHAMLFERQYDEAILAFRQLLRINPDAIVGHTDLGNALFHAGRYEDALAEYEAEPMEGFRYQGRAIVHHVLGNTAESDAAIATLIEIDNDQWAAQIAHARAVRGEVDSAINWLNRGYELFDLGVNIAAVNPFLDNLHGDPRFEEFLRRLGSGD